MSEFTLKDKYCLKDVPLLVERLRNPVNGCLWDKEQTHESIRQNFIEETYEAVDAIDRNCTEDMEEELGDVLLHVCFHAQIEKENGTFDIDNVSDRLIKKMVFRHPHVFKDTTVKSGEQVLADWEKLKREEKQQKKTSDSLEAVPKALPALMRIQKLQKRAAYNEEDISPEELRSRIASICNEKSLSPEAAGDLLFAVVGIIRQSGLDAEQVLFEAGERFIESIKSNECK